VPRAIALAAGHYLATGKTPLGYMQNSGLGNAVNPLTSLADKEVYRIPMLLVIGWRGEPNVKDEPQHAKMGKVTLSLLEALKIPYKILDGNFQEIIKAIVKINTGILCINNLNNICSRGNSGEITSKENNAKKRMKAIDNILGVQYINLLIFLGFI